MGQPTGSNTAAKAIKVPVRSLLRYALRRRARWMYVGIASSGEGVGFALSGALSLSLADPFATPLSAMRAIAIWSWTMYCALQLAFRIRDVLLRRWPYH